MEPDRKPCVGSGLCCLTATCVIGAEIHGAQAPCPSLVWDKEAERYWCGEIMKGSPKEQERLKEQLYVGAGCCMPLFNHLRTERLISLRRRSFEK